MILFVKRNSGIIFIRRGIVQSLKKHAVFIQKLIKKCILKSEI